MKLTQYSHAAGCGCKMAPSELEKLLGERQPSAFKNLLVGNQSNDDAAVWDLGNGEALVSTVDFFMPIVDGAWDFGRIAAANAISDVYAMGAKPIFANALLGWPIGTLPIEMAAEVMEGAKSICAEAGIPIAGGHSIDSKEPIFGLAVNGLIAREKVITNNGAKAGDYLYLTKPLGTGIMGTAIRRGLADPKHEEEVFAVMSALNVIGSKLNTINGVHAVTDVTGFGLLGHLLEMCGTELSAVVFTNNIPYFNFLDSYLQQNIIPDNTYRNWNTWEKKVSGLTDMKWFQLLNDPQTSGGLLIAVDPTLKGELEVLLEAEGLSSYAQPIGQFTALSKSIVNVS
jgi:selenide,water dikinase